MAQITVEHDPGNIRGLAVITPTIHGDPRGYFLETYNQAEMRAEGLDHLFVQDNQSRSGKGVLRGLHYQKRYPQGKLVRVLVGSVYDVAVDLRRGSSTFGAYHGVVLDDVKHQMFYVPQGFAHGFLVLSDYAIFAYKVTDFWRPDDEGGLAWDDPDVHVDWPLRLLEGSPTLLSEKDRGNPTLKALQAEGFAGF